MTAVNFMPDLGDKEKKHGELYKVRFFLTLLFFVVLPWQTRLIARIAPANPAFEYGRLSVYASEMVFGLLLAVWLYSVLPRAAAVFSRGREVWSRPRRMMVGSTAVFFFYAVTRSLLSADPAVSAQHSAWLLMAVLVVFFMVSNFMPRRAVMVGLLAGLTVAACVAIVQTLQQRVEAHAWLGLAQHLPSAGGSSVVERGDGTRFLRAYGPFPHPNILGGFMVLGLMAVYTVRARAKRALFDVIAVFFGAALALSYSRAAWLAWLALLAVCLARCKHARRAVVISAVSFGVSLLVLYPITVTRLAGEARLEERSFDERAAGLREGIALVRKNAWFGVGPGQMAPLLAKTSSVPWWQVSPPHNVALLIVAEYGIVGAVLLALWLGSAARYIKHALIFLLPLVVVSFFDHYMWSLYAGIMMTAVYVSAVALFIHSPSPPPPQK